MSNLNVNGIINCNSVKYASTQVTLGDATFNSRLYVSGASIKTPMYHILHFADSMSSFIERQEALGSDVF